VSVANAIFLADPTVRFALLTNDIGAGMTPRNCHGFPAYGQVLRQTNRGGSSGPTQMNAVIDRYDATVVPYARTFLTVIKRSQS